MEKGQIIVLTLVVISLVLFTTLFIISGSLLYSQNTNFSLQSAQAINLAEAGVDKAIASLNSSAGSYSGDSATVFGSGEYLVTVTTLGNNKVIESTGYVPSKSNAKAKKVVKVQVSKGTGVAFKYGVQVGEGGLQLGSNNKVVGSVYSNGNITSNNDNEITGDAWIARGTKPTADQATDCEGINCIDYIFGKKVSGEDRLDIAQSFTPITTEKLNKVSIKLKKVGLPPDLVVRILKDDGGKPDKSNVLATGTMKSNLVTLEYGFVDVTFDSSPNLNANTMYWLMLDTSANSANYWIWQADLAQSYSRGLASRSHDWKDKNPNWNSLNVDLSFRTYVGGINTFIDGGNNFIARGDVHANTIKNMTIVKSAYYQTIINSTAAGYFPGSEDPSPKSFPISPGNILAWKTEAEKSSIVNGNISSCISSLGPAKIVGNVTFDNSCSVIIKSPIWITGNFDLKNNNTLTLSSEYGSYSGVIIVDGITNFGNGNKLQGTSVAPSILMLLSTYDSVLTGITAIKLNNNANSSFLYADRGIIEPGNNNDFKELTAWQIKLSNNTTINYETGLASAFFSSGPSGSYSLVRGTYQIK